MNNNGIPTVKTVYIMLLGMDDRQFAMFRMAFKMHGTTNYQLVEEGQGTEPEMVLVDADGKPELWARTKERFPNAKVVYFASTPPQVTAPYLAKPIKFDTLFLSLKNLQQGNGIWIARSSAPAAGSVTGAGQSSMTSPASVQNHGASAFSATPSTTEHRPASASAAMSGTSQLRLEHFDPKRGLLGAVNQAMAQESDVAILHDNKPILLVFPSIQRVLLAVDSEALQSLCRREDLALTTRKVAEEHLRAKAKLSTTACLWQLAIWTSNGRLPNNIDVHTTFKVKHWPNLTRLAPLAESMRLSAFLTKTAVNLTMLHKLMSIDQQDLGKFLAATYVTGYLAVDPATAASIAVGKGSTGTGSNAFGGRAAAPHQAHTPSSAGAAHTVAREASEPAPAPKQRGLLQRLMTKIIGR